MWAQHSEDTQLCSSLNTFRVVAAQRAWQQCSRYGRRINSKTESFASLDYQFAAEHTHTVSEIRILPGTTQTNKRKLNFQWCVARRSRHLRSIHILSTNEQTAIAICDLSLSTAIWIRFNYIERALIFPCLSYHLCDNLQCIIFY